MTAGLSSLLEERIYLDGYRDGSRDRAISAAQKLLPRDTDDEIAFVTGLSAEDVAGLRQGRLPADKRIHRRREPYAREAEPPAMMSAEPDFVRLVRERCGMTQKEFADAVGVNERTVRAWEGGNRPVRMKSTAYARIMELGECLGK